MNSTRRTHLQGSFPLLRSRRWKSLQRAATRRELCSGRAQCRVLDTETSGLPRHRTFAFLIGIGIPTENGSSCAVFMPVRTGIGLARGAYDWLFARRGCDLTQDFDSAALKPAPCLTRTGLLRATSTWMCCISPGNLARPPAQPGPPSWKRKLFQIRRAKRTFPAG